MRRITIGTSGIEASAMTLGTWEMGGGTSWGTWEPQEEKDYIRILHAAPEYGVDFVDTAPCTEPGTRKNCWAGH